MTALVAAALIVPAAAHSDHKGPNAPSALRIVSDSPTSLTLAWTAGRGTPAQGFELFRDGESVASTAETSYTFGGLMCGTAYSLEIRAFDATGDHSELASVIAASSACAEAVPAQPVAIAPVRVPSEPPSTPPAEPSPVPVSPSPEPEVPPASPESVPSGDVSWAGAGAFVWHETDVAPEALGLQLRENGFAWVAVLLHDGLTADPVEGDWVRRFREASQLPVGGWGVLRTEPEREAELAHRLLEQYSLDFYIANPEAEYKFSGDDGQSPERYERSRRFVDPFRALEPDMPAAISSYCRADMQDIDWRTWSRSGFVFLPQAYVNDLGGAATPAACAEGAAEFFPANVVHPTIGVYTGQEGAPSPDRYAALLDQAGTVGFSIYLAETRMDTEQWRVFGQAIAEERIARRIGEEIPEALRRRPIAE